MVNNVSDEGVLLDKEVEWLSRGLAEACLRYINSTKAGHGLRVCAYEFTYVPILNALKRANDRGVDVRIIYHKTDQNVTAVETAALDETKTIDGIKTTILFQRTRPPIPHNKFMVKLEGKTPTAVLTGSTNFTDSGFLGQTNVGHIVHDTKTAETYLKYWQELSEDPTHNPALENAVALTPNPPNELSDGVSEFFSPRVADNMLDW
jgi:phosphatidylserine/phosphatidylglycerophosphate/cardiolipin synthase-like enzyme